MRIHSDSLYLSDLMDAARIARVFFDRIEEKGSRSREHAFDVTLTGESRRRPNGGNRGANTDDYAATWDQWGVFLSVLFDRDPAMVTPYYADADDFHHRTAHRFDPEGEDRGRTGFEPNNQHGDHTFRFAGTPREQSCTKCSAIRRW